MLFKLSLCPVGLPFSFKSGFSRYSYDDLLDFFWQVRPTGLSREPQYLQTCSIGGYISSRVYVSLGGTERGKNAFLTATALPTYVCRIVMT